MSSSLKIRASELQSKNKEALMEQLTELRTELTSLRVQKAVGGSASKLTKMCVSIDTCTTFEPRPRRRRRTGGPDVVEDVGGVGGRGRDAFGWTTSRSAGRSGLAFGRVEVRKSCNVELYRA